MPALLALAIAVLDSEQLLAAILRCTDEDEDALTVVVVEADGEVDAVRPTIDILGR